MGTPNGLISAGGGGGCTLVYVGKGGIDYATGEIDLTFTSAPPGGGGGGAGGAGGGAVQWDWKPEPEPSAVDRLAALADEEIAEKVADYDRRHSGERFVHIDPAKPITGVDDGNKILLRLKRDSA
jgi:hypothetical protein